MLTTGVTTTTWVRTVLSNTTMACTDVATLLAGLACSGRHCNLRQFQKDGCFGGVDVGDLASSCWWPTSVVVKDMKPQAVRYVQRGRL